MKQEIAGEPRRLEATDQAEDATHGRSVPEALADGEHRDATIQAAKARLEAEAQARAEGAHTERVARAEATGKLALPLSEEPPQSAPKGQSNFSDPDARITLNADKSFIPDYNAPIEGEVETQMV